MQSEIKIDRFYFEAEQFAVSILSEFELVFRQRRGVGLSIGICIFMKKGKLKNQCCALLGFYDIEFN
jgi:hypothetical protein